MFEAISRNAALFLGMFAAGGLCVLAVPYLDCPRGAPGPTVFQSESPLRALLAVVVCFALATIVACIVGRIVNAAVGLFVLGAGLFALAGRLATAVELAFGSGADGSRSALLWVAVETWVWAALCLAAVAAVFRVAGPLRDVEPPDEFTPHPHPWHSAAALKSALAGVAVLPVVWIIAQSPMKGQMIGATFLGSVAAGLAGRLLAPHVQPMLLFAAPVVFGGIGHVVGWALIRRPLDDVFIARDLPALSLPMPIDYAAGALMGVSFGLGWAKSFLHHEPESPADSAPPAISPGRAPA